MILRPLILFALASCTATSADAARTRTPSATVELAAAFGIDRVETSCRALELHAGNAARTRVLDVDIDAEKLGLRAGTHRLRIGASAALRVEIAEFAGARHGEIDCTDAGTPDQPAQTAAWKATSGELVVTLSADPRIDRTFDADIELVDVVFRDASGTTKRVHARFDDLRVGWLPG